MPIIVKTKAQSRALRQLRKAHSTERSYKYRGKPARFANSTRRYKKNRRIAKGLRNFAETKLLATTPQQEVIPGPIQTGALAFYKAFVMDTRPAAWDANIVELGGITHDQGTGGNQRVGNYVYFKKTHLSVQLDMNFASQPRPPCEFRCVVVKARQSVMPAGNTDNPATSLFLNNLGAPIGYTTAGVTGMDVMLQPINKRDWVVAKDFRFTLSAPFKSDSDGGNVGYSGKYPNRKSFFLNLGYWKKTRMNAVSNTPEDLDPRYIVYIFASRIGKDEQANLWEVSMRGTTSFNDV